MAVFYVRSKHWRGGGRRRRVAFCGHCVIKHSDPKQVRFLKGKNFNTQILFWHRLGVMLLAGPLLLYLEAL